MRTAYVSGAIVTLVLAAGACSKASSPAVLSAPVRSDAQCVDIPDVDLFTVVDGKFRPASATTTTLPVLEIPALIRALGFDWMSAERREDRVTILGEAPDAEAKALGFAAAQAALEAHPDSVAGDIVSIKDRISVANAEAAGLKSRVIDAFDELGFSWMTLTLQDKVAILSGVAANSDVKEAAYAAGRLAIERDPESPQQIMVIVDGISLETGGEPVGVAISALSSAPSIDQCQRAFVQVMAGRNVEFELNQAVISPASARLLDAVTGIALLCGDYGIEVGGHTDARGSDNYNLVLSQERADSVRLYLIDKGVAPSRLTAVGYGETQPLDPAMTNQAYQKNRRTEFTVQPR